MTDKIKKPPASKRAPGKKTRVKKERIKKDLREKINVLALIKALEQHVLGAKEMTSTQVSAALALLKKTLPDMAEGARKGEASAAGHEDALRDLE